MRKKLLLLLLMSSPLLFLTQKTKGQVQKMSKKEARIEYKADKYAYCQDFKRAIKEYQMLIDKYPNQPEGFRIKLKAGRLYLSIRAINQALTLYKDIIDNHPEILSVNDVCDLIEILRREDKDKEAELILRQFIQKPLFSENNRFKNLFLGVIALNQYSKSDTNDYLIKNMPFNDNSSNFWVGLHKNNLIYISNDRYSDSFRNMFKGARFYTFDGINSSLYSNVSINYQAGPASFNADGTTMIFTDNRYSQKETPRHLKKGEVIYNSLQLVQLSYNDKKRKWGKPTVLFKDEETISFAHPYLSPDEKTLIFSSNMKGGFGGMDLYQATWDENKKQWDKITNLGDKVNTPNDELYPYIANNKLYFSSNGQIGLGGFDIFEIALENGIPVDGTLYHFPYPINSSYNDFAFFSERGRDKGYFASDRKGGKGLDDIYSFIRLRSRLEGNGDQELKNRGVLDTGKGNLLSKEDFQYIGIGLESIPQEVLYKTILDTTHLVSLYFDFDKSDLTDQSLKSLDRLVKTSQLPENLQVLIIGYTDEIGTEEYNLNLSKKRSDAVKEWLINRGYSSSLLLSIGRGQVKLSDEEMRNVLVRNKQISSNEKTLVLTKPDIKAKLKVARRVEVKLLSKNEK